MTSEIHSMVLNYYEHLNVPQSATAEVIEKALESLRVSEEARLNNPLTMQSARQVINEIIPEIRRHLLSGEQARAEYDQQLLAAQQRMAHRDELADDEGLDDPLRQPRLDVEGTRRIASFLQPGRRRGTEEAQEQPQVGLGRRERGPDPGHATVAQLRLQRGRERRGGRFGSDLHAVDAEGVPGGLQLERAVGTEQLQHRLLQRVQAGKISDQLVGTQQTERSPPQLEVRAPSLCEGVDREFFRDGRVKSNFLCNIGYGDPKALHPRGPRLSFDQACRTI